MLPRLQLVREAIARSAERSGRSPAEVGLVAVSKGVPVTEIREALAAGVDWVGENRVQEALAKRSEIAELEGRMHLIGHLQGNKVRRAVEIFSLIHGVDSLPLARAIGEEGRRQGKTQDILLQVNVSGEETKFGFSPEAARRVLAEVLAIPGVRVRGLMTIAPRSDSAMNEGPTTSESARPTFRALRELRAAMEADTGHSLPELSMGMTADFSVAIEEGATLVRIGEGLFGPHRRIGRAQEE